MPKTLFPFFVLLALGASLEPQERSSGGDDDGASHDVLPANPGLDLGLGGHWGLVKDGDWVDTRWSKMDTGRFFCCSIGAPPRSVNKAMSIRLGDEKEAAACFDARNLSMRVGWTGPFLALGSRMFGLVENPRIAGEVRFALSGGPAWGEARGRFRGLYPHRERVVLSYVVDDCDVLESPWIETADGVIAFTRTLELGPASGELEMRVAEAGDAVTTRSEAGETRLVAVERDGTAIAVALIGWSGASLRREGKSPVSLVLPAHAGRVRLKLLIWSGLPRQIDAFATLARTSPPPEDLSELTRPGEPRWPHRLETTGTLGDRESPWVIDTIGVPFDNPYKSPMFITGHDFFANGDAAVCTIYGDVWLVRGIDEDLDNVTWKRFATGLYQPFGVRIVDDRVHVLGRDQITLLHDRNGDDEADFHENFNNDWRTIPWPHQFSAALETDSEGNFYFVSPQGVHRVTADGSEHEVLAGGWRNPVSLAVGPDGTITVAPQEGEWTPASQICEVERGDYYGYPGPRTTPERPLGYDPPLCYIPRHIDSSSGGQAWVTGDRWGPLQGRLLNFSFGRCTMQMVLREVVDGVPQGGIVPLRGRFVSGVMRGRFHPRDGQLYVTGSMGWVTSAVADGCFQRVRYTGRRAYLPIALNAHANGLRIEFTEPLARDVAEDIASYDVEQWQYRYARSYGSEEYSVAHPDRVGHDPVRVRSAHLLEDGKSVFLEIPGIAPVMQMHVSGALEAADGTDVPLEIFNTIHRLRPALELDLESDDTDVDDVELERRGDPGLVLTLAARDGKATDTRRSRLAALGVPAGTPASPFLEVGPFGATWTGDLNLDERSRVRFAAEGRGRVRLSIDGAVVLEGGGDDLSAIRARETRLGRGARAFRLEYESPASGDARLRLLWSGRRFAREPVPSTVFTHDPGTPALVRAAELRRGRDLFAARRCIRCHRSDDHAGLVAHGMPELDADAPSLEGIGSRLDAAWLARWIVEPRAMRPGASMPSLAGLLDAGEDAEAIERRARDIAAYLATLTSDLGDGAKHSAKDSANDAATDAATDEEADGAQNSVDTRSPDALAAAGGALFERLGCIACHTLPGAAHDTGSPAERVPLTLVAWKWKAPALRRFLREPRLHHRWSRMPDFALTEDEASELAAFLVRESADRRPDAAPDAGVKGDVDRGRTLVETTGCLDCHAAPGTGRRRAPPLERLAAVDWSRTGCVSEQPRPAPDLGLSDGERGALLRFGRDGLASLRRRNLAEFSQRRVRDLACVACHDRDGEPALWSSLREETEHLAPRRRRETLTAIPGIAIQTVPSLTHTGDKLRTRWLEEFVSGELGDVRPWLEARMPRFPVAADLLARGIVLDHGWPLEPQKSRFVKPGATGGELTERQRIGRRLVSRDQGFGCVSCHASGDRPAEMELHFGAINLGHTSSRLRREFYLRWMLDPQRIAPMTPMPAYTDEDGITSFTNILDGDGRRQYEAIWEYLETVRAPVRR